MTDAVPSTGWWARWLGWARDPDHARRVAVLAQTPMFAGLSRRLLGRLAALLFEKAYAAGDVIFFHGDSARALFVVLDGNVELLIATPPGEQSVASCGPSTVFGELALIDELPRSATARATLPTRLLILYCTDFAALVKGDRHIARVVTQNLLRTLAGYVRTTREAAAERIAAPETPVSPAPDPVRPV